MPPRWTRRCVVWLVWRDTEQGSFLHLIPKTIGQAKCDPIQHAVMNVTELVRENGSQHMLILEEKEIAARDRKCVPRLDRISEVLEGIVDAQRVYGMARIDHPYAPGRGVARAHGAGRSKSAACATHNTRASSSHAMKRLAVEFLGMPSPEDARSVEIAARLLYQCHFPHLAIIACNKMVEIDS
jgi:hypothetical protein